MKSKLKQSGFTLIELIVVIVILGILAATAMPKFIDLSTDAHDAAAAGIAAAISSGTAFNSANCKIAGDTKCRKLNSTTACQPLFLEPYIAGFKAYGWSAEFISGDHQYTLAEMGGDPAASAGGDCSAAANNKAVLCTLRGYDPKLGLFANEAKFKKATVVVTCAR